ncbi:MAG: hypothetical protein AMK71_12285 [Nitrospira bacterium SG8_35_4]|nr:MAG: hypothetical protein AMK71_12285 [Nitrospira bacterium SG8_35_4]
MRNGLYYFAHCLRDLRKTDKAITHYKKDVLLNGSFPTDFLPFEKYLMNKDCDQALAALKNAIVALERIPMQKQ